MEITHSHKLDSKNAKEFLFAGKSTVTLRNSNSGSRFTYNITAPKKQSLDRPVFFVKLFTGSDNEKAYTFTGTLFGKFQYRHSTKSPLNELNKALTVLQAFLRFLERDSIPKDVEVWHEGRCGCCGKKLTTPESIVSGFGPVCQAKRWKAAEARLKLTLVK